MTKEKLKVKVKAYRALKTKMKEQWEEYIEATRKLMQDDCKALFKKHPKLKSFGWRQYTPYWNDGDACTFRTCTDCPDINGYSDGYGYGEPDEMGLTDEEYKVLEKAVIDYLKQFDDKELEHLFGDHVKVQVTPKGIKVEDYCHG